MCAKEANVALRRWPAAGLVVVSLCLSFVPARASFGSDVVWLDDLEAGYRAARTNEGQVLVRVGAEWCGWCEKLSDELERSDVQTALARFTLVYLDADRDTEQVRRLSVGPIPALRVLSPAGKVLASHDGFLEAAELIEWLDAASGNEVDALPDALTSPGPLDHKEVRELLKELGRREPARREAAIRRLSAETDAAGDVVELLRSKKLAVRLSALELLREWHAPLEGLDPWRAETIDDARLEKLAAWADQAAVPPAEPLTAEELEAVRPEIDRFLEADEAEAEAIAARLARFGSRLLDEVYARLKRAAGDRERERLTWLRYRLVATDALALAWPGGLVRLAANDAATRHLAAQELVAQSTADDESLLLEMFGDPDPLVRELSLKALHAVGGARVSKALVRLLDDPEPNVRAAVLKQLAESSSQSPSPSIVPFVSKYSESQRPSPSIVPFVSKYIASETDADLVVHAVRLLRATGGKSAVEALMNLLDHDSWRVRAEAAEALGECVSSREREVTDSLKADVYVALIDLLDDDDGFVVSRAMLGLRHADVPAMIEPLSAAAEKRPELAKPAVEALVGGEHTAAKAIERLMNWTKHPDERLRAAALAGLCAKNADGLGAAFQAALADMSMMVRIAAAEQLVKQFVDDRPYSEEHLETLGAATVSIGDVDDEMDGDADLWKDVTQWLFGNTKKTEKAADSPAVEVAPVEPPAGKAKANRNRPDPWEPWLADFRSGARRPRWSESLVAPLEKMLAGAPGERLAAALALVPLGREDKALPVLRELIAADPKAISDAARALAWLPWTERLAWYDELRSRAHDSETAVLLAHSLTKLRDLRADEPLWQMLASTEASATVAQELLDDLKRVYRIGQPHYSAGSPPPPQIDGEKVKHYAAEGATWQRLVAMALLLETDRDAAAEVARRVYEDAQQDADSRHDMLQFLLLAQEPKQARQTSLDVMRAGDAAARRAALAYLARGAEPLRAFRGGAFRIEAEENFNPAAQVLAPQVPDGLAADDVRPFLTDADPALAAFAGYLLTQLGEPAGLAPLLKQWRAEGAASSLWTPLVYHAIAALDDASQTAILVEIYDGIEHNAVDVRDFYWTIRSMTGPKVLELRKRVRDEVGMDQLR